jgi:hypothetical protein
MERITITDKAKVTAMLEKAGVKFTEGILGENAYSKDSGFRITIREDGNKSTRTVVSYTAAEGVDFIFNEDGSFRGVRIY